MMMVIIPFLFLWSLLSIANNVEAVEIKSKINRYQYNILPSYDGDEEKLFHLKDNMIEPDDYEPKYLNQIDYDINEQMASKQPLPLGKLINQFKLDSMKPLVKNPHLGQPTLTAHELHRRITSTPWSSSSKNGKKVMIMLNNQPISANQVTKALIRSNLNGLSPRQMLDYSLIETLNRNRNYSNNKNNNRLKEDMKGETSVPFMEHVEPSSITRVNQLAPDFRRFPKESQRFRLATLGRIGYDQQNL